MKKTLQNCSPSFPTVLQMLVAAKDSCWATHWDCLWSFLLWVSISNEKISTFPLVNWDLLLTHHYCLFHFDRENPPLTCTTKIFSSDQIKILSCSHSFELSLLLPPSLLSYPTLLSKPPFLNASHPSHFTDCLNEDSLGISKRGGSETAVLWPAFETLLADKWLTYLVYYLPVTDANHSK